MNHGQFCKANQLVAAVHNAEGGIFEGLQSSHTYDFYTRRLPMKYLRFLLIGAMVCAAAGCATTLGPSTPFANNPRYDEFFTMADTNKDGMMSRTEFMEAAGKRYDMMMGKMKKMPADKSQAMMKGDSMTREGFKMFLDEWMVYSGS
jgi:hypothetical protein